MSECGEDLSGGASRSSHVLRAHNWAFAGAGNCKRGLLSFKHSSVDGRSARLTDLGDGEQVNKYWIREPLTVPALSSHVMWGVCLRLTAWVASKFLSNTTRRKPFTPKHWNN